MRRKLFIAAIIFLGAFSFARADQIIESVQQKLKDQGFYYGEITGKKDADTIAAIRRYQIRNGLKVSGELDAETQRSLNVSSTASSNTTPRIATAPTPNRPISPEVAAAPESPAMTQVPVDENNTPTGTVYAPGPRGLRPDTSGVFDGTPFEVAPPDVQRRVLIGAQTVLARPGYYRSGIDGVYGPATEFAVRAYQSRVGLEPNGRLDLDTLSSLGLLPGQQTPGFAPPRRRMLRPRPQFAPTGERIYIPD